MENVMLLNFHILCTLFYAKWLVLLQKLKSHRESGTVSLSMTIVFLLGQRSAIRILC